MIALAFRLRIPGLLLELRLGAATLMVCLSDEMAAGTVHQAQVVNSSTQIGMVKANTMQERRIEVTVSLRSRS